jgi:hypothetical protein
MRAFWQACTVVVHARVANVAAAQAVPQSNSNVRPLVVRVLHTIALDTIEVLKDDAAAPVGPVLSMREYGGTAAMGGVEFSTGNVLPLPTVGEEFVFFLMRNRGDGQYYLAYGSAGAFKVDIVRRRVALSWVVSIATKNEYFGQKEASLDDLLATLRRFRDSKLARRPA